MSLESSTIMYSFIPICYLSFCALLFECDGIVIRNVATDDDMMIQEFTYCNGNVSACMKVPGRICNQDDVLSAYQVQLLENQLSSFQQSTPCPCNDDNCTTRFMMTILLLNELPWNKTDPLYQRKDVAVARMTNTFRIELEKSAKCGENVVIVIVVQEKMLHISIGPAFCKVIHEDHLEDVLSIKQLYFQSGDIYTGIEKLINDMSRINSMAEQGVYWVVVACIITFIMCWIVYTQVAFWCITRRDKKTSWEYWTSFFVCVSTLTGCGALSVVSYFLVAMPILAHKYCETNGADASMAW
ncbi:uncharacterized protein LOC100375844 [Saccoglossus kowalevskii]